MAITVSVSQLNTYLKALLESDDTLRQIFVRGEISNFKKHFQSGHLYFSLKEGNFSINCVMFAGEAKKLKFAPCDGMAAVVMGRVAVYDRTGSCQIYAQNISPDGEGAARLALQKLYEKLSKEGVFERQKLLPIPKFPNKIAVLTSASGAAVKDIVSVWARRWPACELVMIPVSVQGDTAAPSIAEALGKITAETADAAILARGGGSAEDLWVFNDEALVRAVADCVIPVVSAVGHEVDYTLCDLAASRRAATPTAAAELSMPSQEDVLALIAASRSEQRAAIMGIYSARRARLEACDTGRQRRVLCEQLERRRERAQTRFSLIAGSAQKFISDKRSAFLNAAAKLDALSPTATLLRGFSVASDENGVITSAAKLPQGKEFALRLRDGSVGCRSEGEKNG